MSVGTDTDLFYVHLFEKNYCGFPKAERNLKMNILPVERDSPLLFFKFFRKEKKAILEMLSSLCEMFINSRNIQMGTLWAL